MPHIHLETTADLPENAHVPEILDALAAKLGSFETINAASVKAYHTLRPVWTVGQGHPPGFAHCTVALLGGRTLELRKRIAAAMFGLLKENFSQSLGAGESGITLELREMDGETYCK